MSFDVAEWTAYRMAGLAVDAVTDPDPKQAAYASLMLDIHWNVWEARVLSLLEGDSS